MCRQEFASGCVLCRLILLMRLQALAAAHVKAASAANAVAPSPAARASKHRQIGRYLQWAELRGGVLQASSGDIFSRCNITRAFNWGGGGGYLLRLCAALTTVCDPQLHADAVRRPRVVLLLAADEGSTPIIAN
jgi:hypothetical protein